jgi:hypothetical protein
MNRDTRTKIGLDDVVLRRPFHVDYTLPKQKAIHIDRRHRNRDMSVVTVPEKKLHRCLVRASPRQPTMDIRNMSNCCHSAVDRKT